MPHKDKAKHAAYERMRRKTYLKKRLKHNAAYRAKYRASLRARSKVYNRRLRLEVVAALGGKCVSCGIADERVLQVDHVHGGGRKERRALKGQGGIYHRHILANIASGQYQLLCANCNWIKRAENQEVGDKYK